MEVVKPRKTQRRTSNAGQSELFTDSKPLNLLEESQSSTFINNMSLPVHRWFRYSAGFSASWVQAVISKFHGSTPTRTFDPFAGSATTLIASQMSGVESAGLEAHPFIARVAKVKLDWTSNPERFLTKIQAIQQQAAREKPDLDPYPDLIRKCYDDVTLKELDQLRQACKTLNFDEPADRLVWLTLVAILRKTSRVGTAQWQYVLPRKAKRSPQNPALAFHSMAIQMAKDMRQARPLNCPHPILLQGDARLCSGIPDGFANLVITSPPYPNNYDYADATRLEMTFLREIGCWGDLQTSVRQFLVRSCSQHVPEKSINLTAILSSPLLAPIKDEITAVCEELSAIRLVKGGRKTYNLMIACYFRDLAETWFALKRVCASGSKICFVIGDSAPYGVYVPVIPWLGTLALAAGFNSYTFEKTRDRNIKWKNRKHRVPLQEGHLWVEG